MDVNQFIVDYFSLTSMRNPPYYIDGVRDPHFIHLLRDLGFNSGAEIGVLRGEYSERLLQEIPDLTLTCVDSWMGYSGYRDIVSAERFDNLYEEAISRLKPYNARILRNFSIDAAKFIPDNSLDFVYIDAAHDFLNVTQDIYLWEKKVRSGGIVAGHDYSRKRGGRWQCHVKDVVDAYAYSYMINPWYVFSAEKRATWMWVKR